MEDQRQWIQQLRENLSKRLSKEYEKFTNIKSIIIFGSLMRGDFIENISDIDFFTVFRDIPEETETLYEILRNCSEDIPYRVIDFAWTTEETLEDPLNKGFPFKFLTVYQRDFKKNHHVLYGEEIENKLPTYDELKLIEWRLNRINENIERFRERPDLLQITAGETCRLIAIINGAKDISKKEIREKLTQTGDTEALVIFDAYISGVELEKPFSYWKSFIETRITDLKGKQIKKNTM